MLANARKMKIKGRFTKEYKRLKFDMFQNLRPNITKKPLKLVGTSANSSSLVILLGVNKLNKPNLFFITTKPFRLSFIKENRYAK